jgi:hypothetical protein
MGSIILGVRHRVLRIPEPRKNNIMGEWRILDNKMLHNFYPLHNITMVITSRRWVEHITCMGEGDMRVHKKF